MGSEASELDEPAEPMLTDVLVGHGAVQVPYTQADLRALPYAAISIEGRNGLTVVHRWPTLGGGYPITA